MFKESPTHDTVLFVTGTHQVMADRLQIVIQHPPECPGRGSGRDHRKTFHPWKLALNKLAACGMAVSADQYAQLREAGITCESASR